MVQHISKWILKSTPRPPVLSLWCALVLHGCLPTALTALSPKVVTTATADDGTTVSRTEDSSAEGTDDKSVTQSNSVNAETGTLFTDKDGDTESAADSEESANSEHVKTEESSGASSTIIPISDLPASVSLEGMALFDDSVLLATRDLEKSAIALAAFTERYPSAYLGHLNLAVVKVQMGLSRQAQQSFEEALAANADCIPAALGLAQLKERRGDRTGAAADLNILLKRFPDQWNIHAELAQLLARAGNLKRARAEALVAMRGDERNDRAMVALGMVFRRQKKFELSTLALTQALDIAPRNALALNELGLVYWIQKQFSAAVSSFEKAVKLRPHDASMLNNLGAVKNEVGAFRGAIEVLTVATQQVFDNPHYFLNLGNALRGEQRYTDAEKAYRSAEKIGGGTFDALFNLAVLYLENEIQGKDTITRNQEAITLFKDYINKTQTPDIEADEAQGQQRKSRKKEHAIIAAYIKTAQKTIEKELKRQARAKKRAEREAKKRQEVQIENTTSENKKDKDPKSTGPQVLNVTQKNNENAVSGDKTGGNLSPPAEKKNGNVPIEGND